VVATSERELIAGLVGSPPCMSTATSVSVCPGSRRVFKRALGRRRQTADLVQLSKANAPTIGTSMTWTTFTAAAAARGAFRAPCRGRGAHAAAGEEADKSERKANCGHRCSLPYASREREGDLVGVVMVRCGPMRPCARRAACHCPSGVEQHVRLPQGLTATPRPYATVVNGAIHPEIQEVLMCLGHGTE
jgi:hypothetical protein